MKCPHCQAALDDRPDHAPAYQFCPRCGQRLPAELFDAYHTWLGIAPNEQPPSHYRLLGIQVFESNARVIDHAADRQVKHLRSFQVGPHASESQRLLNEVARAHACLVDSSRRAAYDAELKNASPVAEREAPTSVNRQSAGAVQTSPRQPAAAPGISGVNPRPQPRRSTSTYHPLKIVGIVAGGICGLLLGVLVVFYLTGQDFLGMSGRLRPQTSVAAAPPAPTVSAVAVPPAPTVSAAAAPPAPPPPPEATLPDQNQVAAAGSEGGESEKSAQVEPDAGEAAPREEQVTATTVGESKTVSKWSSKTTYATPQPSAPAETVGGTSPESTKVAVAPARMLPFAGPPSMPPGFGPPGFAPPGFGPPGFPGQPVMPNEGPGGVPGSTRGILPATPPGQPRIEVNVSPPAPAKQVPVPTLPLPPVGTSQPVHWTQLKNERGGLVGLSLRDAAINLPPQSHLRIGGYTGQPQNWYVQFSDGKSSSDSTYVALVRVEDDSVTFSWNADFPNLEVQKQLANCLLSYGNGYEKLLFQLREPIMLSPLVLDLDEERQAIEFEINNPPPQNRLLLKIDALHRFPAVASVRDNQKTIAIGKQGVIEFKDIPGAEIIVRFTRRSTDGKLAVRLEPVFRETSTRTFPLTKTRLEKSSAAWALTNREAKSDLKGAKKTLEAAREAMKQLQSNPPQDITQKNAWNQSVVRTRSSGEQAAQLIRKLEAQIQETDARLKVIPQMRRFIESLHATATIKYSICSLVEEAELVLVDARN